MKLKVVDLASDVYVDLTGNFGVDTDDSILIEKVKNPSVICIHILRDRHSTKKAKELVTQLLDITTAKILVSSDELPKKAFVKEKD